jgi:hypothetical protein
MYDRYFFGIVRNIDRVVAHGVMEILWRGFPRTEMFK